MSAATPAQIWALVLLTLREAVRRKVFAALLLFTLIVLSSATFLPAIDDESRFRLIQIWSVRSTLIFAAIVAIFVAGFSLPADMEQRRVYLLTTKPLSKLTLFLGRLLGFYCLLAIFILLMALVSTLYLRVVQSSRGEDFPKVRARPRLFAEALTYEGPPVPFLTTEGHIALDSDDPKAAILYRYDSPDRSALPEELTLEFTLHVSGRGFMRFAGDAEVLCGNDPTPRSVNVRSAIPSVLTVPRSVLPPEGPLEIRIRRADPRLRFIAEPRGLHLYARDELYEWNYLKAMLLLFGHLAAVLTVTLSATTILSAPTSIMLSILFFITTLGYGTIEEGLRTMHDELDRRAELRKSARTRRYADEGLPDWFVQYDIKLVRTLLDAVGNYDVCNPTQYLIKDHAVTPSNLATAAGTVSLRIAALALIGVLLILSREFR